MGKGRLGSSQAQLVPECKVQGLVPAADVGEGTGRVHKSPVAAEGRSRVPAVEHGDLFPCLSLTLQWDLQPRKFLAGTLGS